MLIARAWKIYYKNLIDCMTRVPTDRPEAAAAAKPSGPSSSHEEQLGDDDAVRGWKGKISWRDRLKPQAWDDEVEGSHIGGLRDVAKSLDKIPHVRDQGILIGRRLEKLFEDVPEVKKQLLAAIENKIEDTSVLSEVIDKVVQTVAEVVQCDDIRRGIDMNLHCEVRPQLLADVRRFLGGPDDQVERWNWDGAPLGIEAKPESRNIFPVYADQDPVADPLTLASEGFEGRAVYI